MNTATRLGKFRLGAGALAFACASFAAAAGGASGSIDYAHKNAAVKYAWLIEGPDDMQPGKTLRRLYFSATDIGAKLAACASLSCADGSVSEGATIDFAKDARHLGYWVVLNGQKVQYSGGTEPAAFTIKTDAHDRLAGHVHIDDAAAGGAKIDADFDAALLKSVTSAH